jgi:hypothetical protein
VAIHDDAPRWLQDYHPLEVDLSTLAQFAKALRDEVDLNFRPHVEQIERELDPAHSPFHLRPGFLELEAAWYTHAECKARALDLLAAYAATTAELAAAAEQVANQYRGSDAFAAAQAMDVHNALTDATKTPGTM